MTATLTERSLNATELAGLVLVRYALPGSTPKKVRDDVGKLCFDAELSLEQFETLRDELVSAGFLAKERRSKIALTAAGRERALRFLGVSELPPRSSWTTVIAKHLFPKAMGMPAETAGKLNTGDKLAALFLKLKYGLCASAGASVNQVLEALVCRELGFPEETTLDGLLRLVLSKLVGSKERLAKKQLADQLPLFDTGLSSVTPDAIRRKMVRDWLSSKSTDGQKEQPPTERFDLPAFAATVLTLAKSSPPQDRFHDNKVFIASLWRASQREPNFPRLTLPEFKQRLVEANSQNLLHLSRADLVQAMDPRQVSESETPHLNATFHFVLLEEPRQ